MDDIEQEITRLRAEHEANKSLLQPYIEPHPDLTDPVEVMARAMWRGPLPLDSHECREFARLAIAGLEQCGFAIVPIEPTKEMTKAASAAMSPGLRPTKKWVSCSEKHAIRYRAMVAARLAPHDGGN